MTAMQPWNGVAGKRVLLTGATSGIGLAGAVELARRGAQLVMVARSETKANEAVRRVRAAAGQAAVVDTLLADLASQSSIRQVASKALAQYPTIQVLVNNAGAVYGTRRLSPDGIELTWAVNHLAPFLLTVLLLERLKASAPARVVTTSSAAHQGARIPFDDMSAERSWGGSGFRRYGETKLANVLFTVELARRLEGTGVTANCVHPGVIATKLLLDYMNLPVVGGALARTFGASPEKAATAIVHLAASAEVERITGTYFDGRRVTRSSPASYDETLARRLWEASERLTGLAGVATP